LQLYNLRRIRPLLLWLLLYLSAAGSIQRLQPSLLSALTADLQVTSSRLLALRELLPQANVSAVVAGRPQLLLQETAEVQQAVQALQQLLGVQQVDRWVLMWRCPRLGGGGGWGRLTISEEIAGLV
jgi:hypothetical protein